MTKAKITKADGYLCTPNGFTPQTFAAGEIVEGRVAEWALADHAAARVFDKSEPLENKAEAAPERKRGRPRKAG